MAGLHLVLSGVTPEEHRAMYRMDCAAFELTCPPLTLSELTTDELLLLNNHLAVTMQLLLAVTLAVSLVLPGADAGVHRCVRFLLRLLSYSPIELDHAA